MKFELSRNAEELQLPEPARVVLLPAAGESRRMGRHKLSLPFGQQSLIGQVINNYLAASVDLVVVIRQPDDAQIVDAIEEDPRVLIVTPQIPPSEMKVSIQIGLAAIQSIRGLHDGDIYLLSPPDMPFLTPELVQQLLGNWSRRLDFLFPSCAGKTGHPLLFSKRVAEKIHEIPDGQGFNWLQNSEAFSFSHEELPVDEPGILFDVDTPEAYQRALKKAGFPN